MLQATFGLSKTCQGLNCFLDLLLKHLTLLRLLLDVDWLLKACPFFGADLLTCANLFFTAKISQTLGLVLGFSMGLEFPRSLMGLGKISFEGHPSVSEAIETVATFVQSTSHF